MPDKEPLATRNLNILTICNKVSRFAEEVNKSVSGAVGGFSEADKIRLESYIKALTDYKTFAEKQPILDTPVSHHHGQTMMVRGFPSVDHVDNDAVNEVVQTFRLFWTEMLESQSSNLSNGLISHDWKRYSVFLERFTNLINDYITPTTYIDSPETMPSYAVPPASSSVNN